MCVYAGMNYNNLKAARHNGMTIDPDMMWALTWH